MGYIEIRNPTTRAQLLQLVPKYKNRYLSRETQSPINNSGRQDWNARQRFQNRIASAVLKQGQKPIAFASRTLNKAKRNYTVIERECLAVIWALNKYSTYLAPLLVKVITDYADLSKLTSGKNLPSRIIRSLVLTSTEQLIKEQRQDHNLGHIYKYFEIPDDRSVSGTLCENRPHIERHCNIYVDLRSEAFDFTGSFRHFVNYFHPFSSLVNGMLVFAP
ncbi:hypothetical protein TNCV_4371191 [Trichonephila clavipes]|nr:hypothetical protein TNCV_4371191 [Trichonephila clavipes]